MLRHPFDETIKKYGYEDVVLGYTLEKSHTPILHIDNPVAYREYEPNDVYLRKIEEAVTNLYNLSDKLYLYSPLLSTYKKMERLHMTSFIKKMLIFVSFAVANVNKSKTNLEKQGFL